MIHGNRVRQARELSGLTQAQLAVAVGMKQSAIAQIESSLQQPLAIHADAIAERMGFPLSFFEQPRTIDFPVGSLLFRARATTSGRERTQAYRYAQTFFEAASILAERVKGPSVRLPSFGGDPVEGARLSRASMGLSPDQPIGHLINSVERSGVFVLALPVRLEGRDAFSGQIGGEPSTPWLALSAGAPGDRLRWNVSHELGHLVLHRAPRGDMDSIEREADRFAAEFLLPEQTIREEFVRPITLTQLASLKTRWRVSIQALIQRAHELGITTDRQRKYLFQQLTERGWRVREPVAIERERPRAVRQMAELIYGVPIDMQCLAAELHFSTDLAIAFIDQYVGAPLRTPGEASPPSNLLAWPGQPPRLGHERP